MYVYDKHNKIIIEHLDELNMSIFFYDTEKTSYYSPLDIHSHGVYELYFLLSGDVSFMVNGRIYLLQSGDIILSRPNEYHHVINKSSTACRRFVLFFSGDGAAQIFEDALKNVGSHIVLPIEKRKRFITLCHSLLENDNRHFSRWYKVLELLHLLSYGSSDSIEYDRSVLPSDVVTAMQFIENNISSNITVYAIAKNANVSINTLERHFKDLLGISPKDFLKRKRLTRACTLLSEGKNVQETCDMCGFSDYSHFISLFKKEYEVTPLKFKKQNEN